MTRYPRYFVHGPNANWGDMLEAPDPRHYRILGRDGQSERTLFNLSRTHTFESLCESGHWKETFLFPNCVKLPEGV